MNTQWKNYMRLFVSSKVNIKGHWRLSSLVEASFISCIPHLWTMIMRYDKRCWRNYTSFYHHMSPRTKILPGIWRATFYLTFWSSIYFSSVQSVMSDFLDPHGLQLASLSITNTRSLLKLMSIESVIPSNYLILCHPLLLPPSIFAGIRVFSNESVLHIRWPKY